MHERPLPDMIIIWLGTDFQLLLRIHLTPQLGQQMYRAHWKLHRQLQRKSQQGTFDILSLWSRDKLIVTVIAEGQH